MRIDKIETTSDRQSNFNNQTNYEEALESVQEYGGNPISPSDRDNHDVVVEIEGQEYGLNAEDADETIAALENEFNSEYGPGVDVALTREKNGFGSAGILTPNTERMTVKEAARPLNGD